MLQPKIIASVINNIETDQRVQKVCSTLINDGFKLEVIGTTLKGKPNFKSDFKKHFISICFTKGILLYVEFNIRLFFMLLFKSKKNIILLANDLDALLPNYLISKLFNVPLVFDSHEIFSQVPSLKGKPFKQKIWKSLEQFLVPKIKHFYSVSNGYANWFYKEYNNKPIVIKNVPFRNYYTSSEKLTTDLPSKNNEKIILYQGAINSSRGIGKMIEAMAFVKNAQLWIIGDGPLKPEYESLQQQLKLENKVKFLGRISPNQLKLITPTVDLGLSLEEDLGISYRYALPNKLFDYMHCGIPILGTYLPEIKHIVESYQLGYTITNHEPKHIAERIMTLLAEGKEKYQQHLKIAAQEFCWENEEDKLLKIYSDFKEQI